MHVNSFILFLTIVLIAVFAYMQWKKKQQREAVPAAPKVDKDAALRDEVDRLTAQSAEPPETVYMNLRDEALETQPARFAALPGRQPDDPYGALMELGIPNSVVTLACF